MQQHSYETGDSPLSSTSPARGHVIGVDLGGTNLRLALADLHGSILARWSTSTAGIRLPALIVNLISQGVVALEAQAGLSRIALRAIGVGAPGITDFDRGIVLATSYLMGWRNVPLGELLSSELGVPVVVDNDVNLAALGESSVGAGRGARDFVFIAIGTGVGAGIVLNGQLFRGAAWLAGEIGYMLVPGTSDRPTQDGSPGALETLVGGEGLKAKWHLLRREAQSSLPLDLHATQIFDLAAAGDPLASSLLEQAGRTLAYAVQNLGFVLNCQLVVLGGGVGVHPALAEEIRSVLAQQGSRTGINVIASELGAEAQMYGALHLALAAVRSTDSVSGPHPDPEAPSQDAGSR